jgi:hypothetical protein
MDANEPIQGDAERENYVLKLRKLRKLRKILVSNIETVLQIVKQSNSHFSSLLPHC